MILRCIHCIRDTKTNPCEHCGSSDVVDRTQPHDAHWSRATILLWKCKVCDRHTILGGVAKPDNYCNPQQATTTV